MPDESRKHPRYAVDVAVELQARDGIVRGRSRNVSRGGLCAHTAVPMRVGARVVARIALKFDTEAYSKPLELPARIVWSTPLGGEHQLGAAFFPLSAEQVELLQMFLRYIEEGRARQRALEDDPEPEDPFAS